MSHEYPAPRDTAAAATPASQPASEASAGPALGVALAYYEAWTGGDLERAMTYIAPDVVCDAPAGRLRGAEEYRTFMAQFMQIFVEARMLAAFGDANTALVVYDTKTVPVPSAPAAEHVTVENGKITYSRFIFDRLPFQAARSTAS